MSALVVLGGGKGVTGLRSQAEMTRESRHQGSILCLGQPKRSRLDMEPYDGEVIATSLPASVAKSCLERVLLTLSALADVDKHPRFADTTLDFYSHVCRVAVSGNAQGWSLEKL